MTENASETKKTRKSDLIRKIENIENIDEFVGKLIDFAKSNSSDQTLDLIAAAKSLKISKTVAERLYIAGVPKGLGEYTVVYGKNKVMSPKQTKIMVNKKGNITIGKTLFDEFNKDQLHDEEKYMQGNEFEIEVLSDKIILHRIKTQLEE
jgi:hypothetical protein